MIELTTHIEASDLAHNIAFKLFNSEIKSLILDIDSKVMDFDFSVDLVQSLIKNLGLEPDQTEKILALLNQAAFGEETPE